ncbi:MAG: hypothetical protein ACKO0V_03995 [bacterium]
MLRTAIAAVVLSCLSALTGHAQVIYTSVPTTTTYISESVVVPTTTAAIAVRSILRKLAFLFQIQTRAG